MAARFCLNDFTNSYKVLKCFKVDSVNSYLSYGSCQKAKIQYYCTPDIYKQIVLILSCLSDSVPGRRGSYFQTQTLYLFLRTS